MSSLRLLFRCGRMDSLISHEPCLVEVMMPALRVYVLSADPALAQRLSNYVEAEGDICVLIPSIAELLHAPAAFDCLLLDVSRSNPSAASGFRELLRTIHPERVVFLTEAGDHWARQFAREHGIARILTKPILDLDVRQMLTEWAPCTPGSSARGSADRIVEELPGGRFFFAGCPAMQELYQNIRLLAPVDVPVLILGESGVGKEIVANLLHKHSTRARRPMMDVNCAALPSELLESELFGYEAGAFTGANKAKPGRFEVAHQSTLLLDEIGEMSGMMQAKLLHVLQDGHFSRLGARVSSHVDVRVLAATNVDLEEAIVEKRFREDLYYRLNAFSIHVPPLRERLAEIPGLISEMLRRGAIALDRPTVELSDALFHAAQEYTWPGNLRELRNFVTRLLVLRDERASRAELENKLMQRSQPSAIPIPQPSEPVVIRENMRAVIRGVRDQTEVRLISEALRATGWNRRRAAENLQISYRALLYKIQQYHLSPIAALPVASAPTHSLLEPVSYSQVAHPFS